MARNLGRGFAVLGAFVCLTLWAPWTTSTMSTPVMAQAGGRQPQAGEWRSYGADLASTRYSPLDQINAGNFKNLEVAWRFKTDNFGPRPEVVRLEPPRDFQVFEVAGVDLVERRVPRAGKVRAVAPPLAGR